MIRTTLYLPQDLHLRLKTASQATNCSVSQLAQNILDSGLKSIEEKHTDTMYEALNRLKGIGQAPTTDVSTTIDETLYGEHGVWRGQSSDDTYEQR